MTFIFIVTNFVDKKSRAQWEEKELRAYFVTYFKMIPNILKLCQKCQQMPHPSTGPKKILGWAKCFCARHKIDLHIVPVSNFLCHSLNSVPTQKCLDLQ